MTTLNLETIKNLYYANVIYEMHMAQDKINYFISKYKTDFESFENQVKTGNKEEFERWDDYMEWKGFQKTLYDLNLKKNDIENGNIKVA